MSEITIKEIAKKANISIATVSRAINTPEKVAPSTRKKIMDILEEHDYTPNQLAKGLVKGKSNTLSLITPPGDNFFNAYYFREVFLGITRAAANSRYNILIDQESPRSVGVIQSRFPVDGYIIISSAEGDPFVRNLELKKVPAALINNRSEVLNWVDLDNALSAENAVKHLIDLGHTEIAVLAGKDNVRNSRDRLKGYRNALLSGGLTVKDNYILNGSFHEEKAYQEIKRFITENHQVTAIFACNDLMAMGAIRAVQENGRRVPEDISVIGFDDMALASYVSPSLTTVRQPFYMMGLLAVSSLIEQITQNSLGPVNREFPGELIIRESTGPAKKARQRA